MFVKATKITWICAGFALIPVAMPAASASNVEDEVQLLREQNALLQAQVQKQGAELNALTDKVQKLESSDEAKTIAAGENPPPPGTGYDFGNVHLSAEGGAAGVEIGRATLGAEVDIAEIIASARRRGILPGGDGFGLIGRLQFLHFVRQGI